MANNVSVNNIAKTTKVLNKNLGGTTSFIEGDNLTIITGEVGMGLLIFDASGTIGVVTLYTSQDEFTVTTYALSIDVESILGLSY